MRGVRGVNTVEKRLRIHVVLGRRCIDLSQCQYFRKHITKLCSETKLPRVYIQSEVVESFFLSGVGFRGVRVFAFRV